MCTRTLPVLHSSLAAHGLRILPVPERKAARNPEPPEPQAILNGARLHRTPCKNRKPKCRLRRRSKACICAASYVPRVFGFIRPKTLNPP